MTKITFYGKDFTELKAATYCLVSSDTKYHLDGSDPKEKNYADRLKLLEDFCDSYGNKLRFYSNRERFDRNVGVFRKKEFPFRTETGTETCDVTLEISCRFDKDEKAFFLAAMLLCLNPEAAENLEEVNISFHQVMDIFLLYMYKNQLANGAKKGIFRKYRRFENNDSRPHGTIDIARHIRENMGLENGSVAYHYRELTANNPVNRLILAAYRRLCEKFPTLCEKCINSEERVYSTLKTLQTELGYTKTNVRNIVKENLRPVTHPYFSEYEDLRKTCLKILRDEGVSIFDAECAEETESLCMDVTELWEKFLEFRLGQLKERKDYFGLSLEAQVSEQIFVERSGTCRPDFVLWQEGQARAILDAKFRPAWDKFFSGDDSADIDDDTNKCIRDMVVFQALRTGVIFPGNGLCDAPHKKLHIGAHVFDMVRVPVPLPLVPKKRETSFEEWYKELKDDVDKVLDKYLTTVALCKAKSETTSTQTQV